MPYQGIAESQVCIRDLQILPLIRMLAQTPTGIVPTLWKQRYGAGNLIGTDEIVLLFLPFERNPHVAIDGRSSRRGAAQVKDRPVAGIGHQKARGHRYKSAKDPLAQNAPHRSACLQ
jgi:hypothetical protein